MCTSKLWYIDIRPLSASTESIHRLPSRIRCRATLLSFLRRVTGTEWAETGRQYSRVRVEGVSGCELHVSSCKMTGTRSICCCISPCLSFRPWLSIRIRPPILCTGYSAPLSTVARCAVVPHLLMSPSVRTEDGLTVHQTEYMFCTVQCPSTPFQHRRDCQWRACYEPVGLFWSLCDDISPAQCAYIYLVKLKKMLCPWNIPSTDLLGPLQSRFLFIPRLAT
jgi:hypothetical protein